ncbi:hypothetical protein [Nocardiopsis sp. LOL_012]|uniref:hypothetical protein n=1 Tax=Nocardiopsis sp. LOL_012 TaxID=3345409 RepID=UPI003A8AC8D6
MVSVGQRVEVFVSGVRPWGIDVVTVGGEVGFIDNLKISFSESHGNFPREGDSFEVVILDDMRTPFRASMLELDFH